MDEPTKLKHYELLDRLGEGGMGVVYRARDTRLGRQVALKMLPTELAQSPERTRRFEREARIVSALNHPGIATLYDFDKEGEVAFLTMELVRGSNLRQSLERGPLPLEQALDCGIQVADALAAAHRGGVVHRDLKPENIMASESGYYKVLDFGVARIEDVAGGDPPTTETPTRTWATRAGALIGTVAYMSPEQVLGRTADARSDIFSLGSVLYELVTGRPSFVRASDIATAHAIAYERVEPLRDHRKPVPEGLELVIDKCLAKEPDARYPTAEDLARDLRTLRASTQSGTHRLRDLIAGSEAPRSGRRIAWYAAGAAALLAGLAAALWTLEPDTAPLEMLAPAPALSALDRPSGLAPAREGTRRVVVAFFENNTGDDDAERVSRGLPEMLTTDLARSPDLEMIATQRLHDLLAAAGRDPGEGLDRSTTAELARWAGADVVISGSVFAAGGRYRIDAQAYDTGAGTVVTACKAEGAELFPLVNELTVGLLAGLQVGSHDEKLEPVTPSSEEAFRAFARGNELYDNLAFDEAAVSFREAFVIDPSFALARQRLALSLLAGGRSREATSILRQVLDAPGAMPESDRQLAQGLYAYYGEGDARAGDERFEQLLERYPRSAKAHVWWARALAEVGGKRLQSTRHLRYALEIDPGELQALIGLARHLTELGQSEQARRMLDQALVRHPDAHRAIVRQIEAL